MRYVVILERPVLEHLCLEVEASSPEEAESSANDRYDALCNDGDAPDWQVGKTCDHATIAIEEAAGTGAYSWRNVIRLDEVA